eukprot:CAMPEP_0172518006 /NCGR_PEP_ID=MMETSP1066-20121228/289788_1 /TAXON_ID=671091 /ORGANISM="Coscinodiscus wailesii, Strain CCMP2513" /LENGTH=942 /DNA_ID=CAMNT_0013300273 /DNA_START=116 /DNA_END=2944 /DNA_ORIENTATION=+
MPNEGGMIIPEQPSDTHRSAQVMNSYSVQMILGLDYVSESTASALESRDPTNDIVYAFCSTVNDQADEGRSASSAGVTLFTRTDYQYPATGCAVRKTNFPAQLWDNGGLGNGFGSLEIKVSQIVFASYNRFNEELGEEEIKNHVESGFKGDRGNSFIDDLKGMNEAFEAVQSITVLSRFSTRVEAPSVAPTGMTTVPSLRPSKGVTAPPTFRLTRDPTRAATQTPTTVGTLSGQGTDTESSAEESLVPSPSPSIDLSLLDEVIEDEIFSNKDGMGIKPRSSAAPPSTSEPLPITVIASIAGAAAAVLVAIMFTVYFCRRQAVIKQNQTKMKRYKGKPPPPPPPPPPPRNIPKVPSVVDFEDYCGDVSTLGDYTAGRKEFDYNPNLSSIEMPPKQRVDLDTTVSSIDETSVNKDVVKGAKQMALAVDYEDESIKPQDTRRIVTPTEASSNVKSKQNMNSSPVVTMKSAKITNNNNKNIIYIPDERNSYGHVSFERSLESPIKPRRVEVQQINQEYQDPEPVMVSSDEENEQSVLGPLRSPAPKFPVSCYPIGSGCYDNMGDKQAQTRNEHSSQDHFYSQQQPSQPFDESPNKTPSFEYFKPHAPFQKPSDTHRDNNNVNDMPILGTRANDDDDSWPQEAPTTANILHIKRKKPLEEFAITSDTGVSSFTNGSTNHSDIDMHAIATTAAKKASSTTPPLPPSSSNAAAQYNDDQSQSSSKDGETDTPWLFDQLSSTLGPRGMSADMESLGEKSARSSRHRQRRRKKSSGSIGSRGSRASLKSHKSQLSQMSEASRSVTNDLIRLEAQLAMIGKVNLEKGLDNGGGSSQMSQGSSGGRYSGKGSGGGGGINVIAPPGKLGVILANKVDRSGTVVSDVRTTSPLAYKIFPGDRIVSIDGEDVSHMTVSEITAIMAQKAHMTRNLGVVSRRGENGSVGSAARSAVSS